MTQFFVNLYNHNEIGQSSLHDVMGIIGQQLIALGHQVIWNEEATKKGQFLHGKDGINLVVEGFTDRSINMLQEIYDKGGRFIIIATEQPTPRGFNNGTQEEMVKRQRRFPRLKGIIEGILYLVPGEYVHTWYNQVAPAEYAELGYAPSLMRRWEDKPENRGVPETIVHQGITYKEPPYDFGFFGSLSNRREMLLKRLAKRIGTEKAIRVCASFPSQVERDAEMRLSKIIIQCRKFERMSLVSSSRINTSLTIGRAVIAEPHGNPGIWKNIIHFSETDEKFLDEALYLRAFWKDLYRTQLEKFKTIVTPEFCIGEPLRKMGFRPEGQYSFRMVKEDVAA